MNLDFEFLLMNLYEALHIIIYNGSHDVAVLVAFVQRERRHRGRIS
jgi:hypothetical protein